MNEQPSYYAILTADVRYSKELNFFEKVLYADITALTNKNGYCTASNGYFAELFDNSIRTVSRAISKLEQLGFIKVHMIYKNDTKEVLERRLYLLTKISIPLDKNDYTPRQKCPNPIDKNVQDNNTRDNNTSINKKNTKKEITLPENLNIEAFNQWCEYKGSSYSKQGKTLSINKLVQYPQHIQLQMVENSIMNNYKGLFEIKPTGTAPQQQLQNKSIEQVLQEYIQDRKAGATREIATLQAKQKVNWGLHKDLNWVIADFEYQVHKRAAPAENKEAYNKFIAENSPI